MRRHWSHYHVCHHWFGPSWWYDHPHGFGGWHYHYHVHTRPWSYWWIAPTFTTCVKWFAWTPPPVIWERPVFYDYGAGGNVVYQNNVVYVNGQRVAAADEFAQSAAALATAPPPADEREAARAEWLPLGTFAVTANEKDVDPARALQLAVNRDGVISGTLYNARTDEARTVQGRVDRETQRVAMRVGESEDVVFETGLYNLTQEEAPLLVHYGTDHVESWLLVRLEAPAEDATR